MRGRGPFLCADGARAGHAEHRVLRHGPAVPIHGHGDQQQCGQPGAPRQRFSHQRNRDLAAGRQLQDRRVAERRPFLYHDRLFNDVGP